MIKYAFLISLRSVFRDKVSTIVNLVGLTLAYTAFVLLTQYVEFEKSYDRYHDDAENIYRVIVQKHNENGTITRDALSFCALKLAIENEMTGVKSSARCHPEQGVVTTADKRSFRVKWDWVDPDFLTVFSIPFVYGKEETALKESHALVLSETTAKRIFANTDPIGETLLLSGEHLFTVTGVFKDMPGNSHLSFEVLGSWATIDEKWAFMNNSWNGGYALTYLKLNKETNTNEFTREMNVLLDNYKPRNKELNDTLLLQPVVDIHLKSDLDTGKDAKGVGGNVDILLIISFALLLLAWLNCTNLFAAKSLEKSGDVIKYVSIGAKPVSIYFHFLIQIALINLFSLVLSLFLINLLYDQIQLRISGLDFFSWNDYSYWFKLIGIVFSGIVLSSIYPFTVFLSRGREKIENTMGSQKQPVRKILIATQFMISILLVAGYLIVTAQVKFMQNKDLGIDIMKKLILIGPNANKIYDDAALQKSLRDELSRLLGQRTISLSGSIPGEEMGTKPGVYKGRIFDHENRIEIASNDVDENFLPLYEVKLLAGRNFDPANFNEKSTVILNKRALKMLGFVNPREAIGQYISLGPDNVKEVIGVVEDFHHLSLRNDKIPTIFFYWKKIWRWIRIDYYTIPVKGDYQTTIETAEKVWKDFFPLEPFDYFFLDDFFNQQYKEEMKFKRFFGFFSAFTVVIIGIGLFSLSMFMIKTRSREVGIRKVNGARTWQVVYMMIREYFVIFFIAILLILPLSIYAMNNWLENYAYRTELHPWFYILAILLVAGITLVSVAFGTWNAANKNPVESLRDE